MKLFVKALIVLLLLNVASSSVSAHKYKKDVLGDSIDASDVAVPPVSAGPGIILPDSPVYFLDGTFQSIKLVLISTSEKKAVFHQLAAQERLAELRIMMAKNNTTGIKKALIELNRENDSAARELENAALKGRDVNNLALSINESLKQQHKFLDFLSDQSRGALKLQLDAAKEELKLSKVEVEDYLTEEQILKEVEETIDEEIREDIEEASESARSLEHSIGVLTKLASEAAKNDQAKREIAIILAIENKNEVLRKKEQQQLELELKKQEKIYNLKKEAVESAREVVESAMETAEKLDQAKKLDETPLSL